MNERLLLDHTALNHTLDRLAFQVYERHGDLNNLALVALQPRGVLLGRRIRDRLQKVSSGRPMDYGELDITFYRDDYRRRNEVLVPAATEMNFQVEGRKVVIIDDVLFTGRTVRAGLDALLDFGRPSSVELLVLIDRRHSRELPVQPDYVGRVVNVVNDEKVKVAWTDDDSHNQVLLFKANEIND